MELSISETADLPGWHERLALLLESTGEDIYGNDTDSGHQENVMRLVANVVIVPAHDEDVPAISGIYARRVRAGLFPFETEAPTLTELRRRRVALRSNHFPYLVAFYDSALVGYAYAGPYRDRRDRLTVEDLVCIDPAYAGKGVGRALLDALIHESEVRGFRRMMAVVADRASVRLHRRFGFTVVGAPRGADDAIEPVLMQRPLGKADALSAVA